MSNASGRYGPIEPVAPEDAFNGAIDAFVRLFRLELPLEGWEGFRRIADETYEQLLEVVLIWERIGRDSIEWLEAEREMEAVRERLGRSRTPLGTGEHPELEEVQKRSRVAETAQWLDYKSLFLFSDILLGRYVVLSEPVWDAPEAIEHANGVSSFLTSVTKARANGQFVAPFADFMHRLHTPLAALDNLVGLYRDMFVTHLPPDIVRTGGTASLNIPLDFQRSYGPHRQVSDEELQELRLKLRQVEGKERLPLCPDDEDPRSRLWALAADLPRMKNEAAARTVRRLIKQWGMGSPPIVQVATELNRVLETWAGLLLAQLVPRQAPMLD